MNRDEILQASLSKYGHKYQFKTRKAFERGARWMEKQYEQNRLKHSENLTKEEYDREVAFSEWFYSQGFNRQPTFSDAIEWERKQAQTEIDAIKAQVNEDTYELAYQDAIDSACDWIMKNAHKYCLKSGIAEYAMTLELKQAMKGE